MIISSFLVRSVAAVAFVTISGAASACSDREAGIAAVNAGNLNLSRTLFDRVAIDPTCDDAFRLWMGEGVARQLSREAHTESDVQAKETLLTESLSYGAHWRTYVALATLARDRADHTREASLLQQAINQMNDGPEHHTVSAKEVEDVMSRTSAAFALSDEPVDLTRTRSGNIGGLFASSIRGFTVSEVDLPITFEFDSDVMTTEGENLASKLLTALLADSPSQITIEGHTDPQGDAQYNLSLSERRANAIKNMLIAGGYSGDIRIEARGESDVPPPPPPHAEGSEQHHKLARRVVLVR